MSRECAECGDSERSHDLGFGCRICACPAFVAIGGMDDDECPPEVDSGRPGA